MAYGVIRDSICGCDVRKRRHTGSSDAVDSSSLVPGPAAGGIAYLVDAARILIG